jgi:hypothetical protein
LTKTLCQVIASMNNYCSSNNNIAVIFLKFKQ